MSPGAHFWFGVAFGCALGWIACGSSVSFFTKPTIPKQGISFVFTGGVVLVARWKDEMSSFAVTHEYGPMTKQLCSAAAEALDKIRGFSAACRPTDPNGEPVTAK